MANNKLTDLNNHLFAQLERLSDEDLKEDDLKKEIARAKAINGVAKHIIDNAQVSLEGLKVMYSTVPGDGKVPDQFKLNK